MKCFSLVIPIFIIFIIAFGCFKKIKIYDSFIIGAKRGIKTAISILPYLIAIFIMTELFTVSGISSKFINLISPLLQVLGIPKELAPLVILKPFSGSGSLAILTDIFTNYGVDSYLSRCACAIFGSSETIFYVSAIYFSKAKEKRLTRPIIISLVSTLFSTVFACLICKFI